MGRSSIHILITAFLFIMLSLGQINASASLYFGISDYERDSISSVNFYHTIDPASDLAIKFEKYLRSGKYKESYSLAKNIESLIRDNDWSKDRRIYLTYLLGVCYSANGNLEKAEFFLNQAIDLLNQNPVDSMFGKVYYNLGVIYNRSGDYIRSESYFQKTFETNIKTLRKSDPKLVSEYIIRSIASINLRDYEKGLELADKGIEIVRTKPDSVPGETIALLYQTKGTILSLLFDYHQSILNYRKALEYYDNGLSKETSVYLNMLSNTITAYYFLGQIDQCSVYFRKGEGISSLSGTTEMFNLCLNYSSILAENNMKQKGVDLLTREFKRVQQNFMPDTRFYNFALQEYAGFLLEYGIDPAKSLELYLEAFKYLRRHPWDISLRNNIALGYALALAEKGNYYIALDSIKSVLYYEAGLPVPYDNFTNPPDTLLKADKVTFDILSAKFKILRLLSQKENDVSVVESAAGTARQMIYILEKIRLNIGAEQSRLLLGNKYREAYLDVIQSMSDLYNLTQNPAYLGKAFEYSEKSKASSLLAFIREMKALDGVIPGNLAGMEREIEKKIGIYLKYIDDEHSNEKPDSVKLALWNEIILSATNTRDSLKREFARNYPEYYTLKYDTRVASVSDIRKLAGKKKNYLSYVVSDKMVYIMVVNSAHTLIVKVAVDTAFFHAIQRYRGLLSSPDRNGKVASEFRSFQEVGYYLYTTLIKPVSQYLISDELIISPDNTLAYFPFETLITSEEISDDLQYRTLPYFMNNFRISYAYSATLLSESARTKRTIKNSLIAFAPSYNKPVDVDSLWVNRQETDGMLQELKYAPEEADFVSRLTSGKLFRDSTATKRLFIRIAGNFDIIHLAMHAVLNNNDPANSGMIFSDADNLRDNNLRPYEIYSIRMNAKMVVLSSCFTGAGTLFAGEGVLSIARGFIFAGSRSVVMSLWEVDDRSGTEIIKAFYRNIKSGRSKSESLRQARIDYLKNADMLHSHPYFWSTMVIYGDDSPVYVSWFTRVMFLLIPLLLGLLVFNYFRKR